jgi:hypothetical protein
MLTVPAPALIALSTQRHRKSGSVREPSSGDHSTSSHRLRAWLTLSITRSCTCSGASCSLYFMCSGLVEMKVWMRGLAAPFSASQARSMSLRAARASPATVAFLTRFETSRTASKSPLEAIGNPASMMSTPISSNSDATWIFSSRFIEQPGDCSPSRRVVSKM